MFGCLPWSSSARILPFENPSEDSEDPICAICLESVFHRAINSLNDDIVACSSGIPHQFHRDCIEHYRVCLTRDQEVPCPSCRSVFQGMRGCLVLLSSEEIESEFEVRQVPLLSDSYRSALEEMFRLIEAQDREGLLALMESDERLPRWSGSF